MEKSITFPLTRAQEGVVLLADMLQILYMLALRSYLGHVSGTDDVSANGLLSSRGTLYEKNSAPIRFAQPS